MSAAATSDPVDDPTTQTQYSFTESEAPTTTTTTQGIVEEIGGTGADNVEDRCDEKPPEDQYVKGCSDGAQLFQQYQPKKEYENMPAFMQYNDEQMRAQKERERLSKTIQVVLT